MSALPETVFDAHMHAWDRGRFRMRWTEGLRGFAARGMDAYRAACAGSGIIGSIIVEGDVAPEQRLAEASDFAARRARGEVAAGVACLDPRDPGFADDLDAVVALGGIQGLRWIARTASDAAALAASSEAQAQLERMGTLDLVFDLNVPPDRLGDAAAIAKNVPGTHFVLDHCGNADSAAFGCVQGRPPHHDADAWKRGIDALAALPNVACKISGIVSPLAPGTWTPADLGPVIRHCAAAFGRDRIMFGSDWPVCTLAGTLAQWLASARAAFADRPLSEREAFFGGNARRWYGVVAGME